MELAESLIKMQEDVASFVKGIDSFANSIPYLPVIIVVLFLIYLKVSTDLLRWGE